MERITSHLSYKTRVIAARILLQVGIVIKNVFKNFTLDGLRVIFFLNFLISCLLNSHIFKLFDDLEAWWFILFGIYALQDRWMVDDVFDSYQLKLAYNSLAGQIWFNCKLGEWIISWDRFWGLNWLILFSLFNFNKGFLLLRFLFLIERWMLLLSFRALYKIVF